MMKGRPDQEIRTFFNMVRSKQMVLRQLVSDRRMWKEAWPETNF